MRIVKLFLFVNLIAMAFAFAPNFLMDSGISEPVAIDKYLNNNLPSVTPNPDIQNTTAPLLLSQTGAFSDLENLVPNPGLIPYDMIEPFWSDDASKFRWMAIPNDGTHNTTDEKIIFSNEAPWIFPKGAVLIKHFELGGQKLETRFEVKGADNTYYYLSYKWNDSETDAELFFDGAIEEIIVNGETQSWHFPNVSDCQSCHTPEAGHVLGPKTRQLNKSILYPESGIEANQLVTLSYLGIIDENITNDNTDQYLALAAKDDVNASLEYKARSYLDANCSNCHHPEAINGGLFDARMTTPLEEQNIIYGSLIYDEGLTNPKVILPQDVAHSMIHFRMNSLENGIAMPPLAKQVVDQAGVQLVKDWINSLTPSNNTAPESLISATPVFGQAPLHVSFNGNSSNDEDGDNLSYYWDFGDGTHATTINPDHTYSNVGTYTASLTVDDGEFSDINYVTIEVNNSPPNPTAVAFTDYTDLLNGNNYSGVAIAISDMNGDGKDDIVRFDSADKLEIHYQNEPYSDFSEYNYGSVSSSNQWSTCIADFDQNGFNDVLVGGAYDNIKLIKNNNGDDSFNLNMLGNSGIFLQGSNFADIDNDGWVDIFACHDDGEARAYSNDQTGSFNYNPNFNTDTDPSSDDSGNYASIWTDYDNDGDLDLYISKCRSGVSNSNDPRRINMLFQNDGNNNYQEVADEANLKIGAQTWLTDFGDIDNDGDLDAIVINHYSDCNLMQNNNDGTFTEITATSGLFPTLQGSNAFGVQALFRDFNNDGYLDLIVTGAEHFLFYNNGNGSFTKASNPFNSNEIESLAVGDLNHDGFLDVYAGYANLYTTPSNIADRLFLNNGNENHFISILLEGTASNINAIGARIEIYGSWGKQIREVRSGEGYGIHNSFRQHFGIGQATEIEKIIIKWPSGDEQTIHYPEIDQLITVVEGACFEINQSCDDGDECTIGETFDSTCNCTGGVFQDSDDDGICDANDQCNETDDSLIGTPCDDGDPCTFGETFDTNCQCHGEANSWVQAAPNSIISASLIISPNIIGSNEDIVNFTYVVYNAGTQPLTNIVFTPDESLFSGEPYTTSITPNNAGDPNNNGQLDPQEVWFYTEVKSYDYQEGNIFIVSAGVSGQSACGVEIGGTASLLYTFGENIDITTDKAIVKPGDEVEISLTTRMLINEQAAINPGTHLVKINDQNIRLPLARSQWEGRNLSITCSDLNDGLAFDPFSHDTKINLTNFCDQGGFDTGRNTQNVLDEHESIETVRAPCQVPGENTILCEFPEWVFCYTLTIPEDYNESAYIITAADHFELWKSEETEPGSGLFKPFVNHSENLNLGGSDQHILQVDLLNQTNDQNINHIQVFPNPASDQVKIFSDQYPKNGSFIVRLYNLQGKRLSTEKLLNGDLLNLDAYSDGIYILEIRDQSNTLLANKKMTIAK